MEDKNILILAAIIALTIIEIVALIQGIDGAMMSFITLVIGGLVGYTVPQTIEKLKK